MAADVAAAFEAAEEYQDVFHRVFLQICRGWLSPGGSCNLSDSLLEEAESVAGASLRVANLRDASELSGGFFVADFHQLEGASDYDQELVEVFKF